jgi:hypothetical protein
MMDCLPAFNAVSGALCCPALTSCNGYLQIIVLFCRVRALRWTQNRKEMSSVKLKWQATGIITIPDRGKPAA